jgi:hypothetical protein
MQPWIDWARSSLARLVAQLQSAHGSMARVRVAFVGYRDFDDTPRFVAIPFTDADTVQGELGRVTAYGGGDVAEDVHGGLLTLLDLPYDPAEGDVGVLLHVCDAPCHGKRYHDVLLSDAYPRGDPSGLPTEELVKVRPRVGGGAAPGGRGVA